MNIKEVYDLSKIDISKDFIELSEEEKQKIENNWYYDHTFHRIDYNNPEQYYNEVIRTREKGITRYLCYYCRKFETDGSICLVENKKHDFMTD